MSIRNFVCVGVLWILLAACSATSLLSEYDEEAPFLTYKTFDWAPRDAQSSGIDDLGAFRLDTLVRGALFKELTSRAYRHQVFGAPDFWVNYRGGEVIRVKEGGKATKRVIADVDDLTVQPSMPSGALLVEIIAPKSGRVLWRGWREGVLVEEMQAPSAEFDERVHRLVREILHDFPPR